MQTTVQTIQIYRSIQFNHTVTKDASLREPGKLDTSVLRRVDVPKGNVQQERHFVGGSL